MFVSLWEGGEVIGGVPEEIWQNGSRDEGLQLQGESGEAGTVYLNEEYKDGSKTMRGQDSGRLSPLVVGSDSMWQVYNQVKQDY